MFKSASAVARMLGDQDIWAIVRREAAANLPPGTELPDPRAHQAPLPVLHPPTQQPQVAMTQWFTELSAQRAREVGLADPATARLARATREHTLGVDAKVHSSPVGTLATEVVQHEDRGDPVASPGPRPRCAPRRGSDRLRLRHQSRLPLDPLERAGPRVILGVQHVPEGDGRGEAGAFVDLTRSTARQLPGATHLVADGALRGVHVAEIQVQVGVQVIARTRKQDRQHGGLKINGTHVPAKPLPKSKARTNAFAACGGHDLWGAAGGISERILAVDGSDTWQRVERGQLKRQRKADGTYQWLARHRLACGEDVHQWWEPITPIAADTAAGFNRCEYLRALPADDVDFPRVYGMRADTESYHAELERAFHQQRLPAYGVHRQMLVLLGAAISQNAWALHVFHREHQRQQAPPPAA